MCWGLAWLELVWGLGTEGSASQKNKRGEVGFGEIANLNVGVFFDGMRNSPKPKAQEGGVGAGMGVGGVR